MNLFSEEQFDEKKINNAKIIDTVYIVSYDSIIKYYNRNYFSLDSFKDDSLNHSFPFQNYHLSNKLLEGYKIRSKLIDSLSNENVVVKQKENIIVWRSRSWSWHTITSSYFIIFIMIVLPFLPFTQKPISWNMMIGMLIISVVLAGLVWLNQYLHGLIPVILNRPWINYGINFIIHTGIIRIWLGSISTKKSTTQP